MMFRQPGFVAVSQRGIARRGHGYTLRWIGQRRSRIIGVGVVDGDAATEKLREVAGLHGIGRHRDLPLNGAVVVGPFITAEVEQLVLDDGSADGSAKLVVDQLGRVDLAGRTCPGPRLQVVVAVIFERPTRAGRWCRS